MHVCLAVVCSTFPSPVFAFGVQGIVWVGLDPCLDWDTIHVSGFYAKKKGKKKEGNPIYGRTDAKNINLIRIIYHKADILHMYDVYFCT